MAGSRTPWLKDRLRARGKPRAGGLHKPRGQRTGCNPPTSSLLPPRGTLLAVPRACPSWTARQTSGTPKARLSRIISVFRRSRSMIGLCVRHLWASCSPGSK